MPQDPAPSSAPPALGWEALVAEFRALGGTADNLTLRRGSRGRGLFPIDPKKPVQLRVPPNLLVPTADVEVGDGQLVVKPSSRLGARERAFYDRYQRNYSWGAGVLDELSQEQLAWSRTPNELRDVLREMLPVPDIRFAAPSEQVCLQRYIATRQINCHGAAVLMPVIELINHGDVAGFGFTDGVTAGGTFEDEALVSYGSDDCWGQAVNYNFCSARHYALSLPVAVKFENHRIEVRRLLDQTERVNGFALPTVRVEDDIIRFSFLMLGNVKAPRMPRAGFLEVAKSTPLAQPNELFDIIQHLNAMKFLKFLKVTDGAATPVAAMLRDAAFQQLECMSHHWGTRTLGSGLANPPAAAAMKR